jgi:excisionase family DNA binding protein
MERRWISMVQAAAYLGLSVSGCRKLLARGLIPHSRLGRVIRVDLRALEAPVEFLYAPGRRSGFQLLAARTDWCLALFREAVRCGAE